MIKISLYLKISNLMAKSFRHSVVCTRTTNLGRWHNTGRKKSHIMERKFCQKLLKFVFPPKMHCYKLSFLAKSNFVSKRMFGTCSINCGQINEKQTHFGYQNVSGEEKAHKVHEVFENVASKYDLMNDIMSAGVHRIWKDIFISRLNPRSNIKLLDAAGGTGDITFRIADHIKNGQKTKSFTSENTNSSTDNPNYDITVCDLSQNMLDVGEERAKRKGYENIKWVCGNAQELPFDDNSFDAYTIAYGIRNVVEIEKALEEAYRVLRPGGRFMCLEFSQISNSVLRRVYDEYSFQLIPVMGQIFAGDWKSYQYLVESIRKFPDQEEFKEMIESVGFRKVTYENLTFGVTAIHSGFKI